MIYSVDHYWLFEMASLAIGFKRAFLRPVPAVLRPSRAECRWFIVCICCCYLAISLELFAGRIHVALETGAGMAASYVLGAAAGLSIIWLIACIGAWACALRAREPHSRA